MFLDDPQKKNNIIFSEDDYNQKYTINIPPQKPETTVDDIAVFLFTDYFVIWVRGTGKEASKRFYDAKKHIFSEMRSLNIDRDYEVWENLIQPVKNNTLPNISKKKMIDGSFQISLSFPIAAIDKERFIPLHKLYSDDDSLVNAKVNYRMKLPPNPHYVRRTLHKNDGKAIDVFTVADEGSDYIKEMRMAIDTNSTELLQNNTISLQNKYLNRMDTNYTVVNMDSPEFLTN